MKEQEQEFKKAKQNFEAAYSGENVSGEMRWLQ
jgi:hypothetical protein